MIQLAKTANSSSPYSYQTNLTLIQLKHVNGNQLSATKQLSRGSPLTRMLFNESKGVTERLSELMKTVTKAEMVRHHSVGSIKTSLSPGCGHFYFTYHCGTAQHNRDLAGGAERYAGTYS